MSTISKERVKDILEFGAGRIISPITDDEIRELARIALASLEAEAVAYADPQAFRNFQAGVARREWMWRNPGEDLIAVYTAPPAPVSVPDAMEMDDDFDSAFEHGKAVGWNAYRAAMLQGAEPVSQPCTLPDGYCVMPLKLTSENGAKGALSGEFHVTNRIVCQSCAGEGCEDCNDEGGWDAEIPVSCDTIKRIHEAAVEACSLPAAPQQEVK
ncbi:hypothetical protein [Enterobacter cloacae complex sp. IR5422]|uniref:hypothetical protein n=1 Tax=Enterobacter cloacae complex sp. IR5422 TaxID=3412363 RepID=UPI003BA2FEB6